MIVTVHRPSRDLGEPGSGLSAVGEQGNDYQLGHTLVRDLLIDLNVSSDQLPGCNLLELRNPRFDGWVRVIEAVVPTVAVLKGIVDTHGRGCVIHIPKWFVVLLQFPECADQAGRIASEFDSADIGERLTPTRQRQSDEGSDDKTDDCQ